MNDGFSLQCPVPLSDHATIQLAHGGGGRVMRGLIENLFRPAFAAGRPAEPAHDATVVEWGGGRLAMTTDTFVVSPLEFPGGDIGKLAVCGTVNDLAMAGATPLYLSAGFILEEGLPVELLQRIVQSMQASAQAAGVRIITGDTKVVDRGKGDGIFINTAGIGLVPPGVDVSPRRVQPGDAVLVSGDLGRHGIAIMSLREGLQFEGALASDCQSLAGLAGALRELGGRLHCLRDLTRGGLGAALNEIALDVNVGVTLDETAIPVTETVAAACELLGLDPLYVANEGRLVAIVDASAADEALRIMAGHAESHGPALIGRISTEHPRTVVMRGPLGGNRIVDLLSGEQMPRIC